MVRSSCQAPIMPECKAQHKFASLISLTVFRWIPIKSVHSDLSRFIRNDERVLRHLAKIAITALSDHFSCLKLEEDTRDGAESPTRRVGIHTNPKQRHFDDSAEDFSAEDESPAAKRNRQAKGCQATGQALILQHKNEAEENEAEENEAEDGWRSTCRRQQRHSHGWEPRGGSSLFPARRPLSG